MYSYFYYYYFCIKLKINVDKQDKQGKQLRFEVECWGALMA